MNEKNVSRWAHYKIINAPRYLFASILVLAFFVFLAVLNKDWSYVSRSGGVIALLGALLGLRKLLRKGARELDKENEPLVAEGNRFNINGMLQRVQDLSDSFAQELGLALVVFGTLLSSFGDLLLNVLFPFHT